MFCTVLLCSSYYLHTISRCAHAIVICIWQFRKLPLGEGMWLGQNKSSGWVEVQLRSSDFQMIPVFSPPYHSSHLSEKDFEEHMLSERITSWSTYHYYEEESWGWHLSFGALLLTNFSDFLWTDLENNPSTNWLCHFSVTTKEGAYSLDWVLISYQLLGLEL